MSSIEHRCPKCGKTLFVEDERDYFNPSNGCTLTCDDCKIRLTGVDITCCVDCNRPKKQWMDCNKRLFTTIYQNNEVYAPQQDEVYYNGIF